MAFAVPAVGQLPGRCQRLTARRGVPRSGDAGKDASPAPRSYDKMRPRKRRAEHRELEIGVDDRGRSDGSSARRIEPFDWSQPAFESQETRDRALDALPLTRRQRRNVWWQMVAFAVVCGAVTIALVVMAALRSTSDLFGLAVLTALPALLFTLAAWRTRRLWRGGRSSTSAPSGEGQTR